MFPSISKYAKANIRRFRLFSTINNNAIISSTETEPSTTPLKTWDDIPGPSSLPIIGLIYHFLPGGSLHKFKGFYLQEQLYNTYGPIVKLKGCFGAPDVILLCDAESSAQILRSENVLPKRPGFFTLDYYRKTIKRQRGENEKFTGLITDQGNEWKELRSVVNQVLTKPKSIEAYEEPLQEIVNEAINRIKSLRNNGDYITNKFNEEVMLWILESFGLVTFGTRLNCFDRNLSTDSVQYRLIKNAHDFFDVIHKLDFQPSIWRYYPTRTFRRAMTIYETIEDLNMELINKYIINFNNESASKVENSILKKLLNVDKNMGIYIASDLLFAGIHTVGNMMISILYLLAKHPEKQNKLREELKAKNTRKPYLRACIKEAIRVMPVALGNFRETSKEYNLLGYKIPENTYIIFCHQYMSLMECHFPKPLEYIPERWLADKTDPLYYGNAHPFAFGSFGYGARACVGRRVADMEMEMFVAGIVENFQLEWVGEPLKVEQSLANYAVAPFNFVFKDIKNENIINKLPRP